MKMIVSVALFSLASACGLPGLRAARSPEPMQRDHPSWGLLGDELMREGDPTRAAQYYETSYRAGDRSAFPKLLAACVASRQYALAVDHGRAALARDPSNERLRLLLAALEAESGQSVAAREDFEVAASRQPGDAAAQFAAAVFFRDDAHEPGLADAYFRRYLEIAPVGDHAREARASLLEKLE